VLPSLAVAEVLSTRGALVTFAGSPGRAEAQLVPEAGYELDTFEIAGFPRQPSVALARSLLLAGKAPLACRAILERRRPDVVLGGGGYVAGPMVLAAATKRIPAAIMEADAHLGLANRLALPFARKVFLAFPIPGRSGSKYRVTGRPVPARSRAMPREQARRLFELPAEGPLLVVYGGSQGSRTINEVVVDAFADEGPLVLHLAGERDYVALRGRVSRDGYRLLPFTHEFGAALAAADLALARAGGSVYELAAAGTPAVLVPYPHATADHQTKNARHFADAGAAVLVREEDVRAVPELVRELLGDRARLEGMAAAMRRAARPNAAEEIADEVLALASA
jgi:UDP-N-acetylglucosamine--N-acetylmuramyl-(pentapeptide) pyrophosphoryl-undecaprenol N-acetylglucosamine transferase